MHFVSAFEDVFGEEGEVEGAEGAEGGAEAFAAVDSCGSLVTSNPWAAAIACITFQVEKLRTSTRVIHSLP